MEPKRTLVSFVLSFLLTAAWAGLSSAEPLEEANFQFRRNEVASMFVRVSPEHYVRDAYIKAVGLAYEGQYRKAKNMLKTTLTFQPYYQDFVLLAQVIDDILSERLDKDEALWMCQGLDMLTNAKGEPAEFFTRVIENDPEYALAYYYRALSRILSNPQLALADLDEAATLGLTSSEVSRKRAAVYLSKNSPQEALRNLEMAIASDSTNYNAFLDRAKLYAGQGFLDKAIDDCFRAIKANPVSPVAYGLRASLYADKQAFKEAAFDYVIEGDIYYYYEDTRCKAKEPYQSFIRYAGIDYPRITRNIEKALAELGDKCE